MKRVLRISGLVLLVVSFLYMTYFLYSKSQEPDVVFETDSAFISTIVKKTVATGSITPRKEIEIKSQVSGVVDRIYVEAGEPAKKGQLLAKIRIIPNSVALNNAQTQLRSARINYDNAKKEKDRQEKLFKENIISEVEYNQFKLDFELREEGLSAAESNLQLVREGASKNAGTATNEVRSTVDGMILDVPIREGSFVIESNTFNEGTTIVSVANMQSMIFEGKVDESEVGKIKEGMNLKLVVGALEGESFDATLEHISPKGVEEEGAIQFEVRAAINIQKDVFLRAGYSANADIVLEQKDSVLSLRESNLIFEEDKIFVEVMTGEQQFEKREIETGISDGINIEVVKGLTEEDRVKKL
ncbi:MAG: efflux RND transporter periplasmic adaptor subunit [Cyclobacteriaceae bacterium]|nr:efflux RND transporter periplasmic adaptor subunit [Cyclobacteriaceae bacterium]